MNEFDLRMRLAALRQYLRDNLEMLTSDQVDEILDVISKILEVLNELENKR
ncbi:hypothetical protein [Dyadobacter arcticus]|uniref:DNA-directed RNA polymerase subunit F n=1 Tax=Dyadobacter arcticus TaxID=1078754 RepID=A0ABX0UQ89_9BACT|nr:hypothetical protein [Dyadobacter arcticus]NIJ55157.1 DNA-directed RNA polymerase subunit F [Dyadobacter arcticus]